MHGCAVVEFPVCRYIHTFIENRLELTSPQNQNCGETLLPYVDEPTPHGIGTYRGIRRYLER